MWRILALFIVGDSIAIVSSLSNSISGESSQERDVKILKVSSKSSEMHRLAAFPT
jgi:hypothetical protein